MDEWMVDAKFSHNLLLITEMCCDSSFYDKMNSANHIMKDGYAHRIQ